MRIERSEAGRPGEFEALNDALSYRSRQHKGRAMADDTKG
jgi:hypothetical protein